MEKLYSTARGALKCEPKVRFDIQRIDAITRDPGKWVVISVSPTGRPLRITFQRVDFSPKSAASPEDDDEENKLRITSDNAHMYRVEMEQIQGSMSMSSFYQLPISTMFARNEVQRCLAINRHMSQLEKAFQSFTVKDAATRIATLKNKKKFADISLNEVGIDSDSIKYSSRFYTELNENHISVVRTDHSLIVCIRGTTTLSDIFADVTFQSKDFFNGAVHKGFFHRMKALNVRRFAEVASREKLKLIFTGFSLGGAVAMLSALFLHIKEQDMALSTNAKAIVFGAPLIGDKNLATNLNLLQNVCLNVINQDDIVPAILLFASTSHEIKQAVDSRATQLENFIRPLLQLHPTVNALAQLASGAAAFFKGGVNVISEMAGNVAKQYYPIGIFQFLYQERSSSQQQHGGDMIRWKSEDCINTPFYRQRILDRLGVESLKSPEPNNLERRVKLHDLDQYQVAFVGVSTEADFARGSNQEVSLSLPCHYDEIKDPEATSGFVSVPNFTLCKHELSSFEVKVTSVKMSYSIQKHQAKITVQGSNLTQLAPLSTSALEVFESSSLHVDYKSLEQVSESDDEVVYCIKGLYADDPKPTAVPISSACQFRLFFRTKFAARIQDLIGDEKQIEAPSIERDYERVCITVHTDNIKLVDGDSVSFLDHAYKNFNLLTLLQGAIRVYHESGIAPLAAQSQSSNSQHQDALAGLSLKGYLDRILDKIPSGKRKNSKTGKEEQYDYKDAFDALCVTARAKGVTIDLHEKTGALFKNVHAFITNPFIFETHKQARTRVLKSVLYGGAIVAGSVAMIAGAVLCSPLALAFIPVAAAESLPVAAASAAFACAAQSVAVASLVHNVEERNYTSKVKFLFESLPGSDLSDIVSNDQVSRDYEEALVELVKNTMAKSGKSLADFDRLETAPDDFWKPHVDGRVLVIDAVREAQHELFKFLQIIVLIYMYRVALANDVYLAFAGPSMAGKSTLCSHVFGLETKHGHGRGDRTTQLIAKRICFNPGMLVVDLPGLTDKDATVRELSRLSMPLCSAFIVVIGVMQTDHNGKEIIKRIREEKGNNAHIFVVFTNCDAMWTPDLDKKTPSAGEETTTTKKRRELAQDLNLPPEDVILYSSMNQFFDGGHSHEIAYRMSCMDPPICDPARLLVELKKRILSLYSFTSAEMNKRVKDKVVAALAECPPLAKPVREAAKVYGHNKYPWDSDFVQYFDSQRAKQSSQIAPSSSGGYSSS